MRQSTILIATLLLSCCMLIASLNALTLERRLAKALVQEIRHQLTKSSYSAMADSESYWPETRCTNVDSALNVRTSPGGSVVKTLGPETQVTVYETSNVNGVKWAKIGENQWVSAQFLKMACQESYSGPDSKTGDKAAETLAEIFKSEGRCQNWASDSGNEFQGKIGYTCMGVTPSECWNNRNGFFAPLLSGFSGHPADFCYYAYNQNPSVYKSSAAQLYSENYFGPGGCSNLPQPAFYVCSDIAVNSGTGRSRQYLNEFGGYNGQDAKSFARQLNERHRQDYLYWGRPGTANNKFLQGWLNRANDRAAYIDNY